MHGPTPRWMLVLCACAAAIASPAAQAGTPVEVAQDRLAGSRGQAAAAVEITEYGLYDAWESGSRGAPETSKGTTYRVQQPRLIERTHCIPARPGVRFGIMARVADPSAGIASVRIEVEHPPFALADGRRTTREAWPSFLGDEPTYNGWLFEETYELVPGRWTFSVTRNGRVAARQVFEVVGPNESCPPEVS